MFSYHISHRLSEASFTVVATSKLQLLLDFPLALSFSVLIKKHILSYYAMLC